MKIDENISESELVGRKAAAVWWTLFDEWPPDEIWNGLDELASVDGLPLVSMAMSATALADEQGKLAKPIDRVRYFFGVMRRRRAYRPVSQ